MWHEEPSESIIEVAAHGKGVLALVGGEMAVVDDGTDERPRRLRGAIWFMRPGPAQHPINYPPPVTTATFETTCTDADVEAVSVKAYVTIKRVKPVHSTTFEFLVTFVPREPTAQKPTLAYAVDVTRVE
jgi:hypothetical protein